MRRLLSCPGQFLLSMPSVPARHPGSVWERRCEGLRFAGGYSDAMVVSLLTLFSPARSVFQAASPPARALTLLSP